MAERFFKSAFSYFSGSGVDESSNDMVGKTVQFSDEYKFIIKKVLGEGGFGYVFLAQDVNTGKNYAIKRLCVDAEYVKAVKREINLMKKLNGHPHIIQYVSSTAIPGTRTAHRNAEFMIITDLCPGGSVVDIVNAGLPLTPKQILLVFHQVCLAVEHMHGMTPPIIHRDLKIENLLLDEKGNIRLCDFGSATVERVCPDPSWSHNQRGLAEEEIHRNTTPMYRSPEMIDLYSNHPINEKADIWALGCMLYKLCYCVHPFEDSGTLRILNANYTLPEGDQKYIYFHGIIRSCLEVDPLKRPTIGQLLEELKLVALQYNEDLSSSGPIFSVSHPTTEVTGDIRSGALQKSQQQAQQIWGRVKGGAGSLFKTIKDTSSKVISSVTWGSSSSVDVTYVTSRILVMSFPGNKLEEVRHFLDTNHPEQYLVFNLSDKSYDTTVLHNQVADFEWPPRRAPNLEKLIDLCRSLDSWLRADLKNVIVLHCNDGRLPTASVVAAYLLFVGLFASPLTAYKLFNGERCLDGDFVTPPPSHVRYVGYINQLVSKDKPHSHAVRIKALRMTTVPRMDKKRMSCRPYVEVHVDGDKVYTSVSKEDFSGLKQFSPTDSKVEIAMNITIKGNVVVAVHHVKNINSETNTMSGSKMFYFQFHTGFVSPENSELVFSRSELDGAVSSEDCFPAPFFVGLGLEVKEEGAPMSPSPSWQNLPHPRTSPRICFLNKQEESMVLEGYKQYDKRAVLHTEESEGKKMDQYKEIFTKMQPRPQSHSQPQPQSKPHPQPPPLEDDKSTNFFSQLNWISSDEGYSPYISQEEESSSSSSEEEMPQDPSHEFIQQFNQLGSETEETVATVNLLDVPRSTDQSPVSADLHSSPDDLETGTSDIVANKGFIETGDLIGLGSPPPLSNSDQIPSVSLDPFASTTAVDDSDMYSLFTSTPLHPQQVPIATPLHPQQVPVETPISRSHSANTGEQDQVTFANPSAFNGRSSIPQDPFAGLTPLLSSQGQRRPLSPSSSATHQSSGVGPSVTNASTKPPTSGWSQPTHVTVGKRGQTTNVTTSGRGQPTHTGLSESSSKGKFESVIGRRDDRGTRFAYGPRPNVKEHAFKDLLGDQGFVSGKDKVPRTLKEMKHEVDIEGALDPVTAQIKVWAESKEHNIRALLCSLDTVLWEGESKWEPVEMNQLLHQGQVKKYFRKACLSVHPDKTTGLPHETLARAIFVELNEAYTKFEENGLALKNLY